ncbi:MAG TPA: hypothetical protein VLE02_00950 [Nitrosarchaeum sp.]|nr:hypothetical protein [Nitrosarchaeum sp.]
MNAQFSELHPGSKYYKKHPHGTTEGDVNISKTPCDHMKNTIKQDMEATLIKYPPKSEPYLDIIIAMNNLDGMMGDLAQLSQEQRLQMICEAKRIKKEFDTLKSREHYFHPGRRYWRWRNYRNPYMWYMYRPWGWGYY